MDGAPDDEQPFNLIEATALLKHSHIWPTIWIIIIIISIGAVFYLIFISRTIKVPPIPEPGPTPTPPPPTPGPGVTPRPPPTPSPQTVYGEYIQYQFPQPTRVDAYVLRPTLADEMPVGHLVLGSTDGTFWDLISAQTNVGWSDNVPLTFNLPREMTYTYLRLVVLQMSLETTGYMTLQFTPQFQSVSLFAATANYNPNQLLTNTGSAICSISVSYTPVNSTDDGICTTLAGLAVSLLALTNSRCRFSLKSSIYVLPDYIASSGTMTLIGRNISGTPFIPTPFRPLPPTSTPSPTPLPGPTPTSTPIPQIADIWIRTKSPFKKWVAASMNASGQFQTALEFNGALYCSSDFGMTWVTPLTLTNNWSCVKSSYTGQYQTAAIFNGPIYVTSNFGTSWTSVGMFDAWTGMSISASGQYQFATVSNSYIWYSSNYGLSWSMTSASILAWTSCAVSSNGNYVAATSTNGGILISSDMGVTWTKSNAPNGQWSSVAMSYDGKFLSACQNNGNMYRSTNYGLTWVQAQFPITLTSTQLSNTKCSSLSMSFDGSIQVCVIKSIGVYQSVDSGKTWSLDMSVPRLQSTTPMPSPNSIFTATALGWVCISINYNGKIKSGIENLIYVWQKENIRSSIPNWFNWSLPKPVNTIPAPPRPVITPPPTPGTTPPPGTTPTTPAATPPPIPSYESPIQRWTDIRLSSSGQYQVGVATTGIFVSINYGQYWIKKYTGACNTVAMSFTGKYMSATQTNGRIFVSSNYGGTWNEAGVPISLWSGIAMSGDGSKQIAVIQGGGHYMSNDYGLTWAITTAPTKAWTSITLSADGTIQTATIQNDAIHCLTPSTNNTWKASMSIKSNWVKVACSTNGIYQTAVINNGRIYSSINRGVTWNLSNSPVALWKSISVSSLGDIQVAVAFQGGIYWSFDYGSNWVISSNTLISPWTGVGISYNGTFMSASQTNGSIYLYSQQNTSYSTIQGDWIQIKFENPTPISSYQLIPRKNSVETMIKSFMVLGSMDGMEWVYLDNQTQFIWGSMPSTFYLNTSPYVYLRLVVTHAPMLFEIGGWIINDSNGKPLFSDSYLYTTLNNSVTLSLPFKIKPTPTPAVTPSVTPGVTPAVTPSVTPGVTPAVTPRITPGVTPAVTPVSTPLPTLIATVSWSWSSTVVTSGSNPASIVTATGYLSESYLGIQIPLATYIISGVISDTITVFQYLTPTQNLTSWVAMGEWIQVQLTVPMSISAYQLVPLPNKVDSLPNSFVVVGSNDGTIWYLVSTVTNQFIFSNGASTFPVLTDIRYSFYRLIITQGPSPSGISGFILLDTSGKPIFGKKSSYALSGTLQNIIS